MGSELKRLRAALKLGSSASSLLPAGFSCFMVHSFAVIKTNEPSRCKWKPGAGGAAGFDLSDGASVDGDGCGDSGGNTVGKNSFSGVVNLVASSTEANSIAMMVSGMLWFLLQPTNSRRDVITSSACVFSHFTTDLNSFG